MHLTELAITHFRCLDQVFLYPSPGINFILGANGAGKTSVLEALFCLSRGRSFRANSLNKLIQDDTKSFIVRAKLQTEISQYIALQANRDNSGSNYQAKIDGEQVKSLAELSRVLPAVIIDPAIHKLIEEGPKLRRQYIDWGVFHVEPLFIHEWKRYQQALKQRNAGLKKGLPHTQLQAWTKILIDSGNRIDELRKAYIAQLSLDISDFAADLLDSELKLAYRSGWPKDLSFSEALNKNIEREQKVGLTVVGPHRADLIIQVGDLFLNTEEENDENLSYDPSDNTKSKNQYYAVQQRVSRGQQKLIAASLMLAQVKHFRDIHNISPLLLIDDPFAELDQEHSNRLLEKIDSLQAQTFITTLNSLSHSVFENATKFHVEHRNILKQKNTQSIKTD